jgi:hypothetical protein
LPKNRVFLLFLLIIMLVTTAAGVYVFYKWNKPLGQALYLPTYTPSPRSNAPISALSTLLGSSQDVTSNSNLSATQIPGENQQLPTAAAPTATRQPLCNGPATMTILAIGSDERSTGYLYGLADSIHIVRIDFTVPNIMVIDFPRDLWVEIPEISDYYGITHGKLN